MTTETKTKKGIPEGNVLTPKFRAAFVYLFDKPRQPDEPGKKPTYELVMLFPKDGSVDLAELKKACSQVMTEKFGPDKNKWPKGYKNPFRDGDDPAHSHLNGYAGHTFVRAWSYNPIGVVDERCAIITSGEGFYAGCYGRAVVKPFWFEKGGNKGLAFFLNGLQRAGHGEKFVSRPRPEEMFQQVEVSEEEDDFLAGQGQTPDEF